MFNSSPGWAERKSTFFTDRTKNQLAKILASSSIATPAKYGGFSAIASATANYLLPDTRHKFAVEILNIVYIHI